MLKFVPHILLILEDVFKKILFDTRLSHFQQTILIRQTLFRTVVKFCLILFMTLITIIYSKEKPLEKMKSSKFQFFVDYIYLKKTFFSISFIPCLIL